MLIVIADDFSGAAEIGGIGFRYGLAVELQFSLDISSQADVVVLDAGTRLMNEPDAVKKIESIAIQIKNLHRPVKLFKKVDSVMRGHIVAEINVLQHILGYNRVFLLPANAARGRKIISGHYFINDVPLDKSVFAEDPDFPVRSSSMEELIKKQGSSRLEHIHITAGFVPPHAGLITGDVESKTDLKNYLSGDTVNDLVCGGAECFEAYLERLGYHPKDVVDFHNNENDKLPYTIIVNGSTVKSQDETVIFKKFNVPQLSLPGSWKGNEFLLGKSEENAWQEQVLTSLLECHVAAVSIDKPVKQVKGISEIFSSHFVALINYLSRKIGPEKIHICLTGGATASAVMEGIGAGRLKIINEIASGVVTVGEEGGEKRKFTIKPGSYQWPSSFLEMP